MADGSANKKRCFVVMGFGQKTDYATGRTLDLDKTYRVIIKKAVEDAGLECIRADDVIHSGVIDKPMYELLLDADVVVADLSTSNANAIYELGVRHALRPHTTILMAEDQFKFPFDIAHVAIRTYEHLGKGIDAEEAERCREELTQAIKELAEKQETDSPVYTFLPSLSPPGTAGAPEKTGAAPSEAAGEGESTSVVLGLFQQARTKGDWGMAKNLLLSLTQKTPPVTDPYVLQQLALATYKSKQPDAKTALDEAKAVLLTLKPATTTDPETLGLWGAVHKRLWEIEENPQHLDDAIRAHEKGFYVKDDYYNGINLAFLLNVRASISQESRDAVADFVRAERVRRRVTAICEKLLAAGVKDDEGNPDAEETFWLRATLVEALVGTGNKERAEELKAVAVAEAPEKWMPDSMNEQLEKLQQLIAIEPECE